MDDLTQIKGIGAATAKKLVAAGIDTYAHLGGLKNDDATLMAIEKDAEKRGTWISAAIEIMNAARLADPKRTEGGPDASGAPNQTGAPSASGDPAGGAPDGTISTTPTPAAPPPTKPNTRERGDQGGAGDGVGPARTFAVVSAVLHDGVLVEPGGRVRVTELQFDQLKAGSAVEGAWSDGKDAE